MKTTEKQNALAPFAWTTTCTVARKEGSHFFRTDGHTAFVHYKNNAVYRYECIISLADFNGFFSYIDTEVSLLVESPNRVTTVHIFKMTNKNFKTKK